NKISRVLKKVTLPTLSYEKCNSLYGRVSSHLFCAGVVNGNSDLCGGDYGGPAAYWMNYKIPFLREWGEIYNLL
ncbi:unnamed protein product, partial [Candidula unifasciata]